MIKVPEKYPINQLFTHKTHTHKPLQSHEKTRETFAVYLLMVEPMTTQKNYFFLY